MLNPLPTVAILAGGLATRLRPVTQSVPKSLLEVNGEPFALHQLRLLQANGIRRVVLCVGHLGQLVQRSIGDGDGLGLQVDYSFDGPALLGTAGAIRNALPKLGDSFFVMYGDSYLPCDYAAIARDFESAGVLGMMTVLTFLRPLQSLKERIAPFCAAASSGGMVSPGFGPNMVSRMSFSTSQVALVK